MKGICDAPKRVYSWCARWRRSHDVFRGANNQPLVSIIMIPNPKRKRPPGPASRDLGLTSPGGSNGKGDRNRVADLDQFADNYDQINWGKKSAPTHKKFRKVY